jgi:hypothetical protein
MVKPDRQQPLSGHMLYTALATACTNVLIQITDRLLDTGVMGVQHGPAGRRIPEAVEDRQALGRPQDHVERRHGPRAVGAAQ